MECKHSLHTSCFLNENARQKASVYWCFHFSSFKDKSISSCGRPSMAQRSWLVILNSSCPPVGVSGSMGPRQRGLLSYSHSQVFGTLCPKYFILYRCLYYMYYIFCMVPPSTYTASKLSVVASGYCN